MWAKAWAKGAAIFFAVGAVSGTVLSLIRIIVSRFYETCRRHHRDALLMGRNCIFCRSYCIGSSSIKFLAGVVLGFAFSISVILSTVGIMDGFDYSLKNGLKRAMGDLIFYSKEGFFKFDESLKGIMEKFRIYQYTPIIQTEGFLISGENSKGVLIRGVDGKTFGLVTELHINPKGDEIVIGRELALQFGIKIGDEVVLAMSVSEGYNNGMPFLRRFKVTDVVVHGIYQKDLRFVYINQETLSNIIGTEGRVNVVALNINEKNGSEHYMERVKSIKTQLEDFLPVEFAVKPFWSEFSSLIEAVQIEKFMIQLILQLIVVISIFNILAFIIFLKEKNAKDIFLFQALGLSPKALIKVWGVLLVSIWVFSCLLSIVFVHFFDWILNHVAIFRLPGEIYYLGNLSISLSFMDYLLVFIQAFFWLLIISWVGIWRTRREPLLKGIRKEFI